jgi:hypothetical protein
MEAGIVDERTYDLLGRNFARKGVVNYYSGLYFKSKYGLMTGIAKQIAALFNGRKIVSVNSMVIQMEFYNRTFQRTLGRIGRYESKYRN